MNGTIRKHPAIAGGYIYKAHTEHSWVIRKYPGELYPWGAQKYEAGIPTRHHASGKTRKQLISVIDQIGG